MERVNEEIKQKIIADGKLYNADDVLDEQTKNSDGGFENEYQEIIDENLAKQRKK